MLALFRDPICHTQQVGQSTISHTNLPHRVGNTFNLEQHFNKNHFAQQESEAAGPLHHAAHDCISGWCSLWCLRALLETLHSWNPWAPVPPPEPSPELLIYFLVKVIFMLIFSPVPCCLWLAESQGPGAPWMTPGLDSSPDMSGVCQWTCLQHMALFVQLSPCVLWWVRMLSGSPIAPASSPIMEQPCFCCSFEEEMYVTIFSPLSTISSLQKEMVEARLF